MEAMMELDPVTIPRINSVHRKLAAVMGKLESLQKLGQYEAGNTKYAFVKAGQIADAVRPLLAEQGIMLYQVPQQLEQVRVETKFGHQWKMSGWYEFTFVDGETGDAYSQRWYGEATDSGDKVAQKCATSSRKYFLIATLQIGADEADEEASKLDKKAARAQREQARPQEIVETESQEERRRRFVAAREAQAGALFTDPEGLGAFLSANNFPPGPWASWPDGELRRLKAQLDQEGIARATGGEQ